MVQHAVALFRPLSHQCLQRAAGVRPSRKTSSTSFLAFLPVLGLLSPMPFTLFASTSMPFPFSFRFTVPGIPNPFLAPTSIPPRSKALTSEQTRVNNGLTASRIGLGESGRRSPSPFLAPPRPLARKRGWIPSDSELSRATAVSTSTSGYLDTPAKYRDMAPSNDHDEDEIEEMVGGEYRHVFSVRIREVELRIVSWLTLHAVRMVKTRVGLLVLISSYL